MINLPYFFGHALILQIEGPWGRSVAAKPLARLRGPFEIHVPLDGSQATSAIRGGTHREPTFNANGDAYNSNEREHLTYFETRLTVAEARSPSWT